MRCSPAKTSPPAIIAELATNILALDERLKSLDAQIAEPSTNTPGRHHPVDARLRPILGATLLVAAGDLRASPAPVTSPPRPDWCPSRTTPGAEQATCTARRYSRPLRHVFYLSAQTSMMRDGPTGTTT